MSDGQLINGISDPCPVWTEWAIGASCVMPNTLGTQVLATCPTQFTTGRRRRQINGTNWWSSANRQVVPLAPPTPIPNVDDKRRPYGYGGSYGGYGGFGGQSSFWSSVAAPCGRCAIQFRCRTRAPAYACRYKNLNLKIATH